MIDDFNHSLAIDDRLRQWSVRQDVSRSMNTVLKSWLKEIMDEDPKLLWSISKEVEGLPIRAIEWVEFFQKVNSHINSKSSKTILLYVWFDEMARNLRFASNYCTPTTLPFRCSVKIEKEIDKIISQWLNSNTIIDWTELEEIKDDTKEKLENHTVNVWICSGRD